MAEEVKADPKTEEFFQSKKTYFKLGLVLAFVIVLVIVYRKLKDDKQL